MDINRHKRKARELEMSQQSSVELEKSSVTVLTSVETKERESNAKEPDVENGTQVIAQILSINGTTKSDFLTRVFALQLVIY